jgi:hypothetical protein
MDIDDDFLEKLRENGVISKEEILLKEGDLYVAKNVVSGNRRIIEVSSVVGEGRRLLKG